jgi:hypothetical protein
VIHHPPVFAYFCEGKAGYRVWSTMKAKGKFTGKNVHIIPELKIYCELPAWDEIYEITPSPISINNLLFGTLYIEPAGKLFIREVKKSNVFGEVEFFPRAWKASNSFRASGFASLGSKAKKDAVYKIEGRWNESIAITNIATQEKEVVWTKNPYPEKWEYMYGFTRFQLQLNYFPR